MLRLRQATVRTACLVALASCLAASFPDAASAQSRLLAQFTDGQKLNICYSTRRVVLDLLPNQLVPSRQDPQVDAYVFAIVLQKTGLDFAGEITSSTTPAQLASMMDVSRRSLEQNVPAMARRVARGETPVEDLAITNAECIAEYDAFVRQNRLR